MDLAIASSIAAASLIPILYLSKDVSFLEHTLKEMTGKPILSPDKLYQGLKNG